jgi:hypothetical protein
MSTALNKEDEAKGAAVEFEVGVVMNDQAENKN